MDELTFDYLKASKIEYPKTPEEAKLEIISNRWANEYTVQLICNEFTCVCPVTGQPDFAKIIIDYSPDKFLVESKSLKLYLFSFRNTGIFHEFVINKIANDINTILKPHWITVKGEFSPRGGISIVPLVRLDKNRPVTG